MKLNFLVAAGASLALVVNALRVEKRSKPAVLSVPFQKTPAQNASNVLSKRSGQVETPDLNYQTHLLYLVHLLIGTSSQSIYVQLDTGSSDLVVEFVGSNLCVAPAPNPCSNFGGYNPSASNTYVYIDSNLNVAYGGGDGATGDWVSDDIYFGGAKVSSAQFGVMKTTTVVEGILGVGYEAIESRTQQYPNFPTLLVQQGYIASRAFSLWTNDDRSIAGTVLFGGIDTAKFYGHLVTIDLVPSGFGGSTTVVDFTIPLLGVTGTSNGNPVGFSGGSSTIKVLLDSGTTFTLFPAALVYSIWSSVGATPYSNVPTSAYIPCSVGSSTQTIELAFKGITISVPISQLVVFPDPQNIYCEFGISVTSGTYIIGDTVLSSMYVVYDIDNNQVSLAQTKFNVATENILQIIAGPGGVPDTASLSSSVMSSSTSSLSSSSSSKSSSTMGTSSSVLSSATSIISSSNSIISSSKLSSTAGTSSSASSSTALSVSSSTSAVSSSSKASSIAGASSILSSSVVSSSSSSSLKAGLTTSNLVTSSPSIPSPTPGRPAQCNANNCLRAMEHATATAFCSAYQAGLPAATPANIADACNFLDSKVSSGCACYYTATAGTPIQAVPTTTSKPVIPTTMATTTSHAVVATATPRPSQPPPPLKCNADNCLRAIRGASASDFCTAYLVGAPTSVPTNIQKGCATLSSRVTSACQCYNTAV